MNKKFNAFVGNNGIGKTNLLDAIYYLCLAKSNFTSLDRDIPTFGEDFFRIEGYLENEDGEKAKVVAKVQPGKLKEISWDGKKYSKRSDHLGKIPVVIITPADMVELFATSESRRKYLDTTLIQFDSAYLQQLMIYNRLLKQRNALLKQFAENRTWNETLIQVLDDKMQAPAEYIYQRRKDEIAELLPVFENIHSKLTGNNETCMLSYKSELATKSWNEIMQAARDKDRILKRTTSGIHKDDISFFLEDKKLKTFGSQGQLKSFVFALKLGQFHFIRNKTMKKPILILDDIFDKLDDSRVESLIAIISEADYGQIFISNTSKELIEGIFKNLNLEHHILHLLSEEDQQ